MKNKIEDKKCKIVTIFMSCITPHFSEVLFHSPHGKHDSHVRNDFSQAFFVVKRGSGFYLGVRLRRGKGHVSFR